MCRKLTRLFRTKTSETEKSAGFTITEVVVASALLIIAIVPILQAMTRAQATRTDIERKTCSLTLAQAKLDEIRARSIYHYTDSFFETSVSLGGSYLCNVVDISDGSNIRIIRVSVGYDEDNNSVLGNDEVEITLTTLVAKRW
jgi:type II secretory pathway pseudopilin PulG